MAETPAPQGQQVQLRLDESKLATTYANTIRTSTSGEEMIMDFGLQVPMQLPNQAPVIMLSFTSRVVMNWAGAKRLAMSLGQAVKQYEDRFGEIRLPGNNG